MTVPLRAAPLSARLDGAAVLGREGVMAGIPDYQSLMLPVLEVAAKGETSVPLTDGGSHRNAATQLGRTVDGGVDGVINEDVLGLDRVYVQAKRYGTGSSVGRPDVQAFIGSLVGLGASKGVFVTTSVFSAQAVEFVSRIPQRVILIDGKRLTELMIEHSVGVRSSRVIEFKRLDEDFFTEE